jgi:hypothetical protein
MKEKKLLKIQPLPKVLRVQAGWLNSLDTKVNTFVFNKLPVTVTVTVTVKL